MRIVACLVLASLMMAAGSELSAQLEVITKSDAKPEFLSSLACAKCHLDIHRYWKDSLHAHAYDDYIFQAAFMTALKERGDEVRHICLRCHVPTTVTTDDVMMRLPISAEGITCDFCHRITSVELNEKAHKITLATGKEKYGPLVPRGAKDSHPSVQSSLFTEAKLCAACHQWTNPQGIAIFDTYREWQNGPLAAQGVHCQRCHMPLVAGSILADKAKEPGEKINSHNLTGGHSMERVASAAKVRIASLTRVAGGLHGVVEITNVGSGHMIPTGIPSRTLVLEIQLVDSAGNVVDTQTQTFRRVVLDSQHNELTTDADIILKGALISRDNRIPPGGTVTVPFDFAASPQEQYVVKAMLRYKYKPLVLREEEVNIQMGSDTKGE